MLVLVRELPGFERQREGSFRKWLRCVVNRVRAFTRDRLRRPRDGAADDLAARWDRDLDRRVFDRLLDAVRPDFAAETWAAFQAFALHGRSAADVAAELGTTTNAVVLAKARVLARLRAEAGGLVE